MLSLTNHKNYKPGAIKERCNKLLLWNLINRENYELSATIKKYNIHRESIIENIIKENVEKMYSLCKETSPSQYIPDSEYWDENAQLMEGCDVPPHVDPSNIAYYHYVKINSCEEEECCIDRDAKLDRVIEENKKIFRLKDRNLKLAKLIKEKNITDETILHQLIRRNISVLCYMDSKYVPKKSDPRENYWDETADDQSLNYDPNNIAYYHYLISQVE